jgi:hypothetical protein
MGFLLEMEYTEHWASELGMRRQLISVTWMKPSEKKRIWCKKKNVLIERASRRLAMRVTHDGYLVKWSKAYSVSGWVKHPRAINTYNLIFTPQGA